MQTHKHTAFAAGLVALLAIGSGFTTVARAEDGAKTLELSVLGGIQALNKNDTALPDDFINVPAAVALTYGVSPTWAVQGEFSWMIPVKKSVDLGAAGSQDRRTPNILTYQANVLARLPVASGSWAPYLTAGLGAITFLSDSESDRLPQLAESQTAFAINFGAGTSYALGQRWALRGDLREFAAFPSNDMAGLSSAGKADPIWMERGTLGLAYQF